ncbi:MAG: hypothetical protein IJ002_08165 [Clostridia bacterium]|nr:hypothetical protein [Clostridia bacterium]
MGEKIKKILKFFTLGRIFKFFCFAIMALVVGTLAFRIYTLNHYPSSARGVIATDALSESYSAGTLDGVTWEVPSELDEDGYFFVHEPIYFEKEKTLIITVRYNDSLLETLKHDGGGETLSLYPSVYADDVERVLPVTYEYSYAYGIYSYRRYVFEGVDLAEYEHMYLDVHLDEEYEETPFSTLEIYDTGCKAEKYKLTGADKKELK